MLEALDPIRSAFTEPSFVNFLVVFGGWVLTPGRHAITETLVQTKVSGIFHHEAFHRLFSRAVWCADQAGRLVFQSLQDLIVGDPRIVIDDTVARGKGERVFGMGCHLDASRSTKRFKVLTFGHCWVFLAVIVPVPFSSRQWALPVLFRLYRNKSICKDVEEDFRKKTELARAMLKVFLGWLPEDRKVILSADSAYCCNTVLRGQPRRLTTLGAMASTVALRSPTLPATAAGTRGRRRTLGDRLPKMAALAKDEATPWSTCTANLYGETVEIKYKTFLAHWHQVLGAHTLRVVLVLCTKGAVPFRVYFSTDPELAVEQILFGYSLRWSIEVCFRNLKQHFGFADSSARSQKAVLRTAPFVGLAYSMLVLWFAKSTEIRKAVILPLRPWYPQKKDFSFLDILRAAQAELRSVDFAAKVAERRLPTKSRARAQPSTGRPPPRRAAPPADRTRKRTA